MSTVDPVRRPFCCSRCGRVSWHPEDARQGYCGACHAFTGDLGDVDPVVPFLLARLAEEEIAVNLVGNARVYVEEAPRRVYLRSQETGQRVDLTPITRTFLGACWLDYAARNHPGKAAARIDGIRKIVLAEAGSRVVRFDAGTIEMRKLDDHVYIDGVAITRADFDARYLIPAPPSRTLKLLAQAYGDHPDFDDAWLLDDLHTPAPKET